MDPENKLLEIVKKCDEVESGDRGSFSQLLFIDNQ